MVTMLDQMFNAQSMASPGAPSIVVDSYAAASLAIEVGTKMPGDRFCDGGGVVDIAGASAAAVGGSGGGAPPAAAAFGAAATAAVISSGGGGGGGGGRSRSSGAAAEWGTDVSTGRRSNQQKERRSGRNNSRNLQTLKSDEAETHAAAAPSPDEDPTSNSISTRQWLKIIRLHK